jgi:hypothetical protein
MAGRLARVQVFVASPTHPEDYPVFVGVWPGSQATTSGLLHGDRLTRIGQIDLRGVGPIGFLARVYESRTDGLQVTVSYLRDGQTGEATLPFDPFVGPWGSVLMALSWAACALLVFFRMPRSPLARAFSLAGLIYSIHWCLFFGGSQLQTYAWVGVYFFSSLVMLPLILRMVLIFPEETAPKSPWMYVWPWLFALRGFTAFSWYFGFPFSHEVGMRATHLLEVVFVIVLLTVLTRNFRAAGPLGRRQLKWAVYGLYIGTIPVLAATFIAAFAPQLWWIQEASIGAVILTPLCLFIAIIRFNLFDIDRLINSTAAYTILLSLLATGALFLVPSLTDAVSQFLGLSASVLQLVFFAILALLVIPGQSYLRSYIERIFFAERYALERGITDLLQTLPDCADQHELLSRIGERLSGLLRPESCVIYAYSDTVYSSQFVKGSIVPPIFDARSGLWGAVQTRYAYADEEEWRRAARVLLRPSERAVLDRVRIGFVLPLGQSNPPPFFLVLGPKQSGDVYTATDATLLRKVAQAAAAQLDREVVEQ